MGLRDRKRGNHSIHELRIPNLPHLVYTSIHLHLDQSTGLYLITMCVCTYLLLVRLNLLIVASKFLKYLMNYVFVSSPCLVLGYLLLFFKSPKCRLVKYDKKEKKAFFFYLWPNLNAKFLHYPNLSHYEVIAYIPGAYCFLFLGTDP